MNVAASLPYVYRWNRQDRQGQPCMMTARGKMNSVRVEFADGYVMITSGNAIRKAKPIGASDGTPGDVARPAGGAASLPEHREGASETRREAKQ